jgi:hypothetical protein
MSRQAELADQEDVQWRAERASDLIRHRHAAAGQRQDYDIVAAAKLMQTGSEL